MALKSFPFFFFLINCEVFAADMLRYYSWNFETFNEGFYNK